MRPPEETATNPDPEKIRHEHDLCLHIFSVSAGLVGVCLTVIGLLRVVITLRRVNTVGDELLATDALMFLLACLLSYWALRSRRVRRLHRIEKAADTLFGAGLLLMVAVCVLIALATVM